ncbi:MAG: DUF3782 domain-containing protein [Crocosphaera sp.]|nr:DUF3782 domain-containing protein [Crocosphaera sp.]
MADSAEIKTLIREQLPSILAEDASIRDFILRTVSDYYSPKGETDRKFEEFKERVDRILDELQRDREEQARKWDEQRQLWQENNHKWDEQKQLWQENNHKWDEQRQLWQENNRKWDEQRQLWDEQRQLWDENNRKWDEQRQLWDENNRKWDEQKQLWDEQRQLWQENNRKWDEQRQLWQENNRKWDEQRQLWDENNRRLDNFIHEQNQKWHEQHQQNQETLAEIKQMNRKHDSTIGALGSRWGLFSERSFRNALAAILEESFGVEVLNINDYDSDGIVFGRPDQVEIDVIIKNGLVIVCEIKSSMSKSDIYTFSRKVEFYQQKYQRQVNRKIVVSPMIDDTAFPIAESLGIEVYSYADDVYVEN